MKNILEYVGIMLLITLLNLLPISIAASVGRWIGNLWYRFDKRRKEIALDNLKHAFGEEKGEEEREEIARGAFQHLCITALEICRTFSSDDEFLKSTLQVEGIENVHEAKRKGKGIIFFGAHLGNWELGSLWYTQQFPSNMIARRFDNPLLEKKISQLRMKYGGKVIHKQGALRNSLRILKQNEDLGILIDQSAVKKEGVFVDFFGRQTCTNSLLVILALRTGCPVIPLMNTRMKNGKNKTVFFKEVKLSRTGDTQKDIGENTAKLTKIVESFIRQYPDQWLWMHRRWKTQP